MVTLNTDVLVIGGGATGTAVAWDAALRGLDVTLVERHDLAQGTSGRFHGLLHSGGRYAVKDQSAAAECIAENWILRRIAGDCIEDTGGLFVTTPFDDPGYADKFRAGALASGVDCEEIPVALALREEPRLNPRISRAFRVPDGNIEVWKLLGAMADGVRERGGRILTYHELLAIHHDRGGDAVVGARVRDLRAGVEFDIRARMTVNAGGPWSGQVAALAGIEGVRVIPGRGVMVAMNHRLVNTVINRCQPPSDGDILVPVRTVSVIGTTDNHVEDPDDLTVKQSEVDLMFDYGEQLIPGFRSARALRVWAGVRPLFEDAKAAGGADRDVTRTHALLDHRERDGVGGFVTITGGKLTTCRLMAEQTVDLVCSALGEARRCETATEPLPGVAGGPGGSDGSGGIGRSGGAERSYQLSSRLERKERHLRDEQMICECELVPRADLEAALRETGSTVLDDMRRRLRLGMGPCQGGFCIYRTTGIMHELSRLSADQADQALRDFLQERWHGTWPILYGDQLRQVRFDEWIYHGVMDIDHLPGIVGAGAAAPAGAAAAQDSGADS